MNTSRQLGQVEICSTLRDLICHILWPFYCHFMAFFGSKWPYWAIGSPSDPKWVEHWLNMVEHCTSHLGGWVWTPLAPQKWHFGAPEPPKNDLFWPKNAILGHRQSQRPQLGWTWLNIVLHIWGGEFGPFLPPKNGSTALLGPPKGLVLAPKGPFLGPLRSSEGLGGQIWSQLLPIGPAGLVTWLPHSLALYRPSSEPPGAPKGPVLGQNVFFWGPNLLLTFNFWGG